LSILLLPEVVVVVMLKTVAREVVVVECYQHLQQVLLLVPIL
jgi:hypothetical protein